MKEYNILVAGVGGQGVLTLAGIIARTAVNNGLDVKSSELHGLAMRFGSIRTHIKISEKLDSPLISYENADIIISNEPLEAIRAMPYAGKQTIFVVDTKKQVPVMAYIDKKKYPSLKEIEKELKRVSKKVIFVNASKDAEKLGSAIMANTYLLGVLAKQKILPFKKEDFLKTLKQVVPEKSYNDNVKIFEAGYK